MRASLALLCSLLLTAGIALAEGKGSSGGSEPRGVVGSPAAKSIVGGKWTGTDSDGDYYEFMFLPGGQVKFGSGTRDALSWYEDEGDVWAQNGSIVLIALTKYATWQGTVSGDTISGESWNLKEQRWTWTLRRE